LSGAVASSEALAGLVERVTFHNAENGFCVLRVKVRVLIFTENWALPQSMW